MSQVDRSLTARGARKPADVHVIGDGTVNVVLAMWSLHSPRNRVTRWRRTGWIWTGAKE